MTRIADVIAELTKAAEDASTLSEDEKFRLLGRAYVTIKEGRKLLGEPAHLEESAEAMNLIQAGCLPLQLYDDEMKALMLEAVKVIRQMEAATKSPFPSSAGDAAPNKRCHSTSSVSSLAGAPCRSSGEICNKAMPFTPSRSYFSLAMASRNSLCRFNNPTGPTESGSNDCRVLA